MRKSYVKSHINGRDDFVKAVFDLESVINLFALGLFYLCQKKAFRWRAEGLMGRRSDGLFYVPNECAKSEHLVGLVQVFEAFEQWLYFLVLDNGDYCGAH